MQQLVQPFSRECQTFARTSATGTAIARTATTTGRSNRAYGDDYWKESNKRAKVEYDYRERDNRDEDRHRGRGGGDDCWRVERFDAGERGGKGGFGRGRDDRDGRRGGGDRGDFDLHPPRDLPASARGATATP